MIIRPATLSDLDSLTDMAETMADQYYPKLRADAVKIRKLAIESISTAKHYALVAENKPGDVDGALIAFITTNAWAQRQNAHVMLWMSTIPGAGAVMLRQFRDWVYSRRAIKVAGFAPDVDLDPRIWKLAERIGFKRYGGAYLLYN